MTGIELLTEARRLRPDLPVILMTAYASVRTAVEAMRRGAHDYIQKPFEKDDLLILVSRTLEHARLKRENHALREAVSAIDPPRPLIGSSPAMDAVRAQIERVARTRAAV